MSEAPLDPVSDIRPSPATPHAVEAAPRTAPPPSLPPQAAAQIAQTVGELVVQGKSGAAEIRLDPPELGRVSIHVSVEGDAITAVLMGERAETVDLMRRWGDHLIRLLSDAGFAGTQLSFSDNRPSDSPEGASQEADTNPQQPTETRRPVGLTTGLDLRL
ncbi:flagellar hook-length control protein FliK [Pontivivens insulae]|nr:flagellar hook-length control protein FliK [Pontivivens insulae]